MNSELQHTPRPWVVYDDSNDGKTNRIEIAAMGKTVARIYNSVPEQDMPNAHLIASAPDLLVYAQCQEAYNNSLKPGSSGSYDYMELFTSHGFGGKGNRETVFQFLDRLRREALAKAEGRSHGKIEG